MALPEISEQRLKHLSHTKKSQTELQVPVLCSGRLQSEISSKTKGGLRPTRVFFYVLTLLI